MLPNGRTLIIVSVVAFASNWQFGYQITYVNTASSAFNEFANEFYHDDSGGQNTTLPYKEWSNKWSFVVSSFYPGTFIGFVLVPYLIRRVGVRRSLLYSSYPSIIGCTLQLFNRAFAQYSLNTFVCFMALGRVLVGIQAGCSLCLLPLFIIEAAPMENRPFLSSLQEVFQAFSTLLGLAIGTLPLASDQLEWFQVIALAPMCMFIIFLFFLPDTPLFLLEDRPVSDCDEQQYITPDDAFNEENVHFEHEFYRSVTFYHGDSVNVSSIREEAFERWGVEMNNSDKGLRGFENIKGIIIGSLAGISLAFTADDVIDSYSSQLFKRVKNPDAEIGEGGFSVPFYMQFITILLGLWLLITSIFGAYLIDRFGRKKLIIAGLIGCSVSNLFAVYGASVSSITLITIGFAFTKSFIGFGAGGPAWFLTSELVSPKITCTAQSISTGLLLLMTGMVTLLFLPFEVSFGATGSLLVLTCVPSFVIALLLILFLPETKDRSYEEIRYLLGAKFFSGFGHDDQTEEWQQFIGNNFNPQAHTSSITTTRSQYTRPKYQRMLSASSYASYGSLWNAVNRQQSQNPSQSNLSSPNRYHYSEL